MVDSVVEIADKGFYKFVESSKLPVAVKFWDPWCGICAEMAPVFEGLAKKFAGKMVFAGINMRENPKMAKDFEVYITPTFIFFKEGKEASRLGGLLEPQELEAEVKRYA